MCSYGDPADIWNENVRRAAKDYVCVECGLRIPRGARYVCVDALFEGQWSSTRFHIECGDLAWTLGEIFCSGEYGLGQLKEHLAEAGIDWASHATNFAGGLGPSIEPTAAARAKSCEALVEIYRDDPRAALHEQRVRRELSLLSGLDGIEILRRWQAIESRYTSSEPDLGESGG